MPVLLAKGSTDSERTDHWVEKYSKNTVPSERFRVGPEPKPESNCQGCFRDFDVFRGMFASLIKDGIKDGDIPTIAAANS